MSRCGQETCGNWTGDGCACAVLDLDSTCGACGDGMHEHCERLRRASSCCCDDEEAS